jgi:uncharacterized protein with NRDE domain
MCLILLAWHAHPGYPLVFAGNRDEAYERPSAPAGFWEDEGELYGGRDLDQGGTWLGLRRNGRFAAVTNYRDGPARKPAPRSRGHLTLGFLRGGDDPESYLAKIAPDAALYGGFTLLAGDGERLFSFSNRGGGIDALSAGVHGLSNHLINTPWPKIVQGKRRLSALLGAGEEQLVQGLFAALAERTVAGDAELPDTGVGATRERELSPAFIAGERYGTRASTVVLVDRAGGVRFFERRFGALGTPLGETDCRFGLQSKRASGRVTKAAGHDV